MHFFVLSTLLGICVSTKAIKPKSINVALETVFEFDKPSDVDFIDQVQGILNKVKNVLKNNPKIYRTERYKFTNFLEDAINVLKSFNDEDLREIVHLVNDEIRKHLQGNNTFEDNVRRFLSDEYNRFKIRPIKKIRKDLDQLLRKVKNGKHENSDNNFLGFINTLYKRDSEQKLSRFIRKLKIFRRQNISRKSETFQQGVRRLLSSVIFEHFLNLSEDTKRKLVAIIEDYLHDAVSKDEHNNSSSQNELKPEVVVHYGVEAEKLNEVNNESNISSEAIDDKKRYVNLIQDQNKSQIVEEIRDRRDPSKEFFKKESIGTSGETSRETDNAKRNFKRKIKRNNKTAPSIKVQRRYQNVKMKQTQYSKESEERSSGEIIRKENTKLKITHYPKLTKSPNSKMTYSRRKFIHNRMLHPKDFENDKLKTVILNTKPVEKGNIEKAENDKILNDITLSSISNSAEINVNFKNNKMQFLVKDRDDTVEDTLVRAKDSRQNTMANRAEDKQPDKPTNGQIDSQDSTENRHKTSKKRFKTVNRSRRLFRGHNNVDKYLHKAPKLVEYEQGKFNINKIDNFKKNVDAGKTNTNKKSPKIDDFRRRDYILAKELIADKLNARKKFDQIEYNRPQNAGDHTIENNTSHEKFNTININNDISAQNKPDGALPKASKNYSYIDDLHIAKTKLVNMFKTKEITHHEQQDGDNNIAVNVAVTNIRTIELTTENEPSYKRTKEPDKIGEVSFNNTRSNKNVLTEFNINNISSVSRIPDSKSNEKLSNKSYISNYNAHIIENLEKAHENKSNIQKHNMPQTHATEPTLVEFTRKIKDFYHDKFGREKITNVKQKRNGIKSVLKNRNEMFETDLKPNKAKTRDVRRLFSGITRNINKINNLEPVEATKQSNSDKILNNKAVFNKKSTTNKNTNSYNNGINTDATRKILNISAISTSKMNKIIESKRKETKSNVYEVNNSAILPTTTPKTKSSTTINTNTSSDILKYKLVNKPKENINNIRQLNENEIKSNVTKLIDSRRMPSTLKTTALIDLDANLDDLAFEATMADVNTNITEADNTFDINKYLRNRELTVGEDEPKNEIAKKMKEDLENIFTMPASSPTTTAAYTDIFEALENAFDL